MTTDDKDQSDLADASERILVQCKKDILSAIRNAKNERGESIDQDGRMFILATFLHGYILAIAELSDLLKMPLLPVLTEVVCSMAGNRNLEGLEEAIHQLLHRLDRSIPDGDLNQMKMEVLDMMAARAGKKSPFDEFGIEMPKAKKGDFDVN